MNTEEYLFMCILHHYPYAVWDADAVMKTPEDIACACSAAKTIDTVEVLYNNAIGSVPFAGEDIFSKCEIQRLVPLEKDASRSSSVTDASAMGGSSPTSTKKCAVQGVVEWFGTEEQQYGVNLLQREALNYLPFEVVLTTNEPHAILFEDVIPEKHSWELLVSDKPIEVDSYLFNYRYQAISNTYRCINDILA